ncbi:MAG: proline dehydrogenase [Cirrosporium novae-zelandiae]|nr:MAG: proline dehydrogenase [Cirrosporium novae-zelandiae]
MTTTTVKRTYASTPPPIRTSPSTSSKASLSIHTLTPTTTATPSSIVPVIHTPGTPLSFLSTPMLLLSLLITTCTSRPLLLRTSLAIFSLLANAKSPLLSPDKNPLLRYLLKNTFYAQFCAGETPQEVRKTVRDLKDRGFRGVMMSFAREVVLKGKDADGASRKSEMTKEEKERDITILRGWAQGNLDSIAVTEKGDMVALKFSGAGMGVIGALARKEGPSKEAEKAIVEICEAAFQKGVCLLFDAEQTTVQEGIDKWTLEFMKRYNGKVKGYACVYGTYQAYLKSTPKTVAKHLAAARVGGYTLGVKLVRGAYLASDPRNLIWDTKEDTDKAFDSISEQLIRRRYGGILEALDGEAAHDFPDVNLALASHNMLSVKKAMDIRKEQTQKGEQKIYMVYGQLMGMADEVSGEILKAGRIVSQEKGMLEEVPRAYKYLVWGTVSECMKYLLRRAEENRDAVGRTKDSQKALKEELWKRVMRRV